VDAQPSTLLRACGRQLRSPWPQTAFAGQAHGAQPCVSSGCLGWVKSAVLRAGPLLPVYPNKQTISERRRISDWGHLSSAEATASKREFAFHPPIRAQKHAFSDWNWTAT